MKNQTRNMNITLLRGIAIISVLFYHFSLFNNGFDNVGLHSPFYLGVELFFIISGYGIGRSFIHHKDNTCSFLWKRCLKIYPSLITTICIAVCVNFYFLHANISDVMREMFARSESVFFQDCLSLLTAQYHVHGHGVYSFGHFWYVGVTLQFYAAFAIFLWLTERIKIQSERSRTRCLLIPSLIIAAFLLCGRFVIFVSHGTIILPRFSSYLIEFRFDFIFYGIILSTIPTGKVRIPLNRRNAIAVQLLLLIVPYIVVPFCGDSVGSIYSEVYLTGLGYPLCAVCFFIIVLLTTIKDSPGNGDISAWYCRIVKWFGQKSYSIYCLNLIGIQLTWIIINRWFSWSFNNGMYGLVQFIIGSAVCIALGEVNYRLVEWPFSKISRLKYYAFQHNTTLTQMAVNAMENADETQEF